MAGAGEVVRNLNEWANHRRAEVVMLAEAWAKTLESRAKQNAPWTDRTGHARQGLFGDVSVEPDEVTILLAHSVDYGVYLELANDGRYAILKPTLDDAVPEIYRSYEQLWKGSG